MCDNSVFAIPSEHHHCGTQVGSRFVLGLSTNVRHCVYLAMVGGGHHVIKEFPHYISSK